MAEEGAFWAEAKSASEPTDAISTLFTLLAAGRGQLTAAAIPHYRTVTRQVLNFCCRRGLSRDDAEDVAQEVFVSLLRNYGELASVESPRAYFWQMVRNRLNDVVTSKYHKTDSLDAIVDATDRPDDGAAGQTGPLDYSVEVQRYQLCLEGSLTLYAKRRPEQVNAVIMAIHGHISLEDLAAILNKAYGATRQFLSAARTELRDLVLKRCGPLPDGVGD